MCDSAGYGAFRGLAVIDDAFAKLLNERNTEPFKSKVPFWIASQSRYSRALLVDLCWKVEYTTLEEDSSAILTPY